MKADISDIPVLLMILLLTALDFYGALRSRTYDKSILKV